MPSKMGTSLVTIILSLLMPKKAKETLMTRLSGITITETKTFVRLEKFTWWKTALNARIWKLAKMSTFNLPKCPSAVFTVRLTFSDFLRKKSTYWGYSGCQSSWNEKGRMNARSWSIWRRFWVNLLTKEMLYYC